MKAHIIKTITIDDKVDKTLLLLALHVYEEFGVWGVSPEEVKPEANFRNDKIVSDLLAQLERKFENDIPLKLNANDLRMLSVALTGLKLMLLDTGEVPDNYDEDTLNENIEQHLGILEEILLKLGYSL